MTSEEQKQIKDLLDEKYECYILIGQEKEFEETDLWLNAYTMGIMSLMEGAFKQYPPLKVIIKRMITELDEETLYTEKQVREAIVLSSLSNVDSLPDRCDEIIQLVKNNKNGK